VSGQAHADDGGPAPAFTTAIDGRIVRGYLANRRAMLRELAGQGFRRSAILQRARELGLTEQFVKWCAIGHPAVALRACLGCGVSFVSVGAHNRLCPRCRHRES